MNRTFFVAGVKFRPRNEISQVLKEAKAGQFLGIVPEPTNKFDPNAIKLEYNFETSDGIQSIFIGYVPKKFSSEISALLEIGVPLQAKIEEVNPSSSTREKFKVTISDPIEEESEESLNEDLCGSEE